MTHVLAIVPADGVENTGAISGEFRLRAQVPAEQQYDPFGYLVIESGGSQPATAGGNNVRVWRLAAIHPPSGPLVRNATSKDLFSLMSGLPDCVLLVEPESVQALRTVCAALDYQLTVHGFRGRLST